MADRRWTCPNQCGVPGRLAPERARSDDTRTYCLPCSERTGRLVRRVCETAEKRREKRAQTKAERAKARRLKELENEAQVMINEAGAISTGQSIRTGYYWRNTRTGQRHYGAMVPLGSGWERRKFSPPFAQIAATIFAACSWFPYATDAARVATMRGLELIDGIAPGLFPLGAREYLEGLARVEESQRSSGSLYNWTVVCAALEKDAKRANRTTMSIDPPTATVIVDAPHVRVTLAKDEPLAQLVRAEVLRRIREGHSVLHPIADEIECAPTAFRGH